MIWNLVAFIVIVVFFLWLRSDHLYKLAGKSKESACFEVTEADGEIELVTSAGSWWDHGLRSDLAVQGIDRCTLVGRDESGNMILEIDVDPREDAAQIARKISASHSVRMNPTTDWSGREDFEELLK